MTDPILLTPLRNFDPRIDLDDRALALASRNAFPVVAASPGGKDRASLAVGGAIALLLGGATFWTMAGHRSPAPARPAGHRGAPAAPAVGVTPAPAPAPRATAMQVPAVAPAPLAPAPGAPDAAHSPLMVYDVSAVPASAPAAAPPASVAAKSGATQPLAENDAFAARVGDVGVETASATRVVDPATTITQGTLIPAVLETAIDSDLPGYVRALVSQDVRSFDGTRILIPRSSRLIGQYKSGLAAGQTRAYVMWTRLLRPDGVSVALASPAIDQAGRTGLTGEVDGHFMKRFGSAILLSVVGAAGAVASSGTSVVLSTSGTSAASVAAQRDAQIPPTIRIRQGQPIRIFTARDLDFSTATTP